MVSVTWRVVTGVTETAGGGGAPWAAAMPPETLKLSAQTTTFQATEVRTGIGLAPDCGGDVRFGTLALRQPIPMQNRHPQTVPLPRRRVTPVGHVRPCRPDTCRSGRRPRYVGCTSGPRDCTRARPAPARRSCDSAALREARRRQDGKRKSESNYGYSFVSNTHGQLLDSKAYRFISLLNIWPLTSTPARRNEAQRCFAPGAPPGRVHDRMKGLCRLGWKPAPRHPLLS